MKRRMKIKEMMTLLKDEPIHTWFDLGIFIDRVKENSPVPVVEFEGDINDFKSRIGDGGIAFITFLYSYTKI